MEQGYMIVDGDLVDSVADIAGYIDNMNGEAENGPLSQIAGELATAEDAQQQQQLYFALAEGSATLLSAPAAEFESLYNLLLYVLSSAPDFDALMPVILANLTSELPESNGQQLAVLAVLGNLFNIISPSSPLRFDVFNKIVDFAAASDTLRQLIPQLGQLSGWLREWGVDETAKRELYAKLVGLLDKLDAKDSYELLLSASSSASSDASSENADLAKMLVSRALENTFTYDFDELLGLASVQALQKADAELFKTLEVVSAGDYATFKGLSAASNPKITAKARVLALAKLASTKSAIPFDEIAALVDINAAAVEILVIDAIKAGLLVGRMNQLRGELLVEKVTPVGAFGIEQWKEIDERLTAWKQSLSKVSEIAKSATSNAERVNELDGLVKA